MASGEEWKKNINYSPFANHHRPYPYFHAPISRCKYFRTPGMKQTTIGAVVASVRGEVVVFAGLRKVWQSADSGAISASSLCRDDRRRHPARFQNQETTSYMSRPKESRGSHGTGIADGRDGQRLKERCAPNGAGCARFPAGVRCAMKQRAQTELREPGAKHGQPIARAPINEAGAAVLHHGPPVPARDRDRSICKSSSCFQAEARRVRRRGLFFLL